MFSCGLEFDSPYLLITVSHSVKAQSSIWKLCTLSDYLSVHILQYSG